jgi:hypothetical protein
MTILKRQSVLAAIAFATLLAVHPTFAAQDHVVSAAEIQKEAVAATSARQQNVETVNRFLSSPQAAPALESTHMNAAQVKTAVSKLSDQEVAELAVKANKAQADFAAGTFSDRDLIFIALAVLLVILIIVAVR